MGRWYQDRAEERLSSPVYQFAAYLVLFIAEELVSWCQEIKNSHFLIIGHKSPSATCL